MTTSTATPPRADNRGIPLDRQKIKALREKLGLSQAEAARRAGLSGRQTWWHIEIGKINNPTLDTIERVAAALGVKARDLLK
jgi:transcriptional regulator with XRE-family HTH domain